jgi:hypothetical protein
MSDHQVQAWLPEGTAVAGQEWASSGGTVLQGVNGQWLWRNVCKSGWYLDNSQEDKGRDTPASRALGASCKGSQTTALDPINSRPR